VQRPPDLAPGQRPIGGLGALARGHQIGADDGVDLAVVARQALQIVVEQLERAELAATDGGGELLRRPEGDVVHAGSLPAFIVGL
jgi:hypothetical protein